MDAESYEVQRQANIAENLALLQSLGLSRAKSSSNRSSTKNKRSASEKDQVKSVSTGSKRKKPSRLEEQPKSASTTQNIRRSGRARKPAIYFTEEVRDEKSRISKRPSFIEEDSQYGTEDGEADYVDRKDQNRSYSPRSMPMRKAQRLGVRIESPKQFGHIPFVPVGTWWASRMVSESKMQDE